MMTPQNPSVANELAPFFRNLLNACMINDLNDSGMTENRNRSEGSPKPVVEDVHLKSSGNAREASTDERT